MDRSYLRSGLFDSIERTYIRKVAYVCEGICSIGSEKGRDLENLSGKTRDG